MSINNKIQLFGKKTSYSLNKKSKKILCHGHFDLIHPGHLRFLENASKKGTELIVAVYNDEFYKDNDKVNHYNVKIRSRNLASIVFVHKVIIIKPNELHKLIEQVNFSQFLLGEEFKEERKEEVSLAIACAKKNNTKITYHGGEKFILESTFKSSQAEVRKERWVEFLSLMSLKKIDILDSIIKIKKTKKKKITILGDVVVDNYVSCLPLGMSEEAPLVVVKEMNEKKFLGGAGIVAKHIRLMGNKPYLISVLGNDENYDFVSEDLKKVNIGKYLIRDNSRPTTLKTRYLVENQKIFRTSRLSEKKITTDYENKIIAKLKTIGDKEILVISDFVYGVVTNNILNAINKIKKNKKLTLIGDLQCSSQIGDVSKFLEFDLICATEKEARIALHDYNSGIERIANLLISKSRVKNLILKLGSDGFIFYHCNRNNSLERIHFDALEPNPVDLAGAGDTLLSAMAISLSANIDPITGAAISACASATAVQRLGNTPIGLDDIHRLISQKI